MYSWGKYVETKIFTIILDFTTRQGKIENLKKFKTLCCVLKYNTFTLGSVGHHFDARISVTNGYLESI